MRVSDPRNQRGKDGKLYLKVCPHCHRENLSSFVMIALCAWCGWNEENFIPEPEPYEWTGFGYQGEDK